MTRKHEWEVQGLLHKVRKCRKINTEIEQKNNKIAACSKFKWALFYAYKLPFLTRYNKWNLCNYTCISNHVLNTIDFKHW